MEERTDGPHMRLADGRQVRLRKKTTPLIIQIPVAQGGRTETHWHIIRFAVPPDKRQRALLGRHALTKLKKEIFARDRLPRAAARRMGLYDCGGGTRGGWLSLNNTSDVPRQDFARICSQCRVQRGSGNPAESHGAGQSASFIKEKRNEETGVPGRQQRRRER